MTIITKNSGVQNQVPQTNELQKGELALNTRDGKLFSLIGPDGQETVQELGGSSSGEESELKNINEGHQGWTLKGDNRDNKGAIGEKALDLSFSDTASSTLGSTGINSISFGKETEASGEGSFASGGKTKASGTASFTEGYQTEASGGMSHAEGSENISSGNMSHSEGFQNISEGILSHTEGTGNLVTGRISHSEGQDNLISSFMSSSKGQGNIIGLGCKINDIDYNNKEIKIEDTELRGLSFDIDDVVYVSTDNDQSLDEVKIYHNKGTIQSVSNNSGITTLGLNINWKTTTSNNPLILNRTKTEEDNFHGWNTSEGFRNISSGAMSHSGGYRTTASGLFSHSEGYETVASGKSSNATGYYTTASGYNSHSEGYYTTASGYNSHSEGYYTTASGYNSHSEGYYTTASGYNSHSEGYHTKTNNRNSHVQGKWNVGTDTDTIHETGIGVDDTHRKNAFEIFTDGRVRVPELTNALVDNARSVITKEYADANYGGGGGGSTFDGLDDTNITGKADLDYIKWDAASSKWINAQPGTMSIDEISDVDTTTTAPTNGQVLKWDGTNWVPDDDGADTIDGGSY